MKFKKLTNINNRISQKLQNEMMALRESIHHDPELSNQEFRTQKKLIKEFEKCNVSSIDVIETGIIARIKGHNASRAPIVIRVDIDALPIQENSGLNYASKNNQIMHACGHDVHATWGIGTARLLSEVPPESDVIIICQPAEELATGAKLIMNSNGIPDNAGAIFGGHVDRRYLVGEVASQVGAMSSYSDSFKITIYGQSAHAARPLEGVNPIPELANICQKLEQINQSVGNQTNIISITETHAGNRHNIIPEQAIVSGTMRCLSKDVQQQFHQALSAIESENNKIRIACEIIPRSPAVINSPQLESIAKKSIKTSINEKSCIPLKQPNMASEDFGFYLEKVPGWYFRFGARYNDQPFIPVHTPEFYAEDETIFIGMLVFSNCAYLASKTFS